MTEIDRTMKSPLSIAPSLLLSSVGLAVGIAAHLFLVDANAFKKLTLIHGFAYVLVMCLILAWREPPRVLRALTWCACFYAQGYVFVIIVLATILKK